MAMIMHHLLIALVPLMVTGILHMLLVKNDVFSALAIPIANKTFGANKTWRGIWFVSICNAGILWLFDRWLDLHVVHPAILGGLLGLAYMLAELPNSYFKRRMGIKPGEESRDHLRKFQLLDKTDSSLGVTLLYYLMGYVDFMTAILIFVIGVVVHMSVSKILYEARIKKGY